MTTKELGIYAKENGFPLEPNIGPDDVPIHTYDLGDFLMVDVTFGPVTDQELDDWCAYDIKPPGWPRIATARAYVHPMAAEYEREEMVV